MKIYRKNHPWTHHIIEGFLRPKDFDKIIELTDGLARGKNNSRYSGFIKPKCESSQTICKIYSERVDLLVEKYFPDVNMDDYAILIEYSSCGKGFEYPIHNDAPEKLFSMVHYISPDNSEGTKLYNKDRSFHSEAEWKPNNALMFRRTEDTWHSYNSKNFVRQTINIILAEKTKKSLDRIRYNDEKSQINIIK